MKSTFFSIPVAEAKRTGWLNDFDDGGNSQGAQRIYADNGIVSQEIRVGNPIALASH